MNGQKKQRLADPQVPPELVIESYRAAGDLVRFGRFLEQCFLDHVYLHGRPVNPEAVFEALHHANLPLELARFLRQLFLRDQSLFGQPVPPELVVGEFEALGSALELGRFSATCCLRGLLINGRPVTAKTVVDLLHTAKAPLELARFKADCCMAGILLHGQPVSPDEVVKDYRGIGALQECARFRQECCLKKIPLDGQPVTPEMVANAYLKANAPLGMARFMEHCCLKQLPLFGKMVPPGQVISNVPATAAGRLSAVRFKEHGCLKGLWINGGMITPEEVISDYERRGWKLEKAVFCTQLALHARKLRGQYLDNQQVMQAFADSPGRHVKKKMQYLLQRLNTFPELDDTGEAVATFELACQVISEIKSRNDYYDYQQCIMHFLAMQYGLSIDAQVVTPEQVWQLIAQLRYCYRNIRLQFFFLAHCCKAGLHLHDKPVDRQQVMSCLQKLPREIDPHHTLARWFESSCDLPDEASVINGQALRQKNLNSKRAKALPCAGSSPTTHELSPSMLTIAAVSPMARKVLTIIQEINNTPGDPPLQITGSFSRYLQGVCTSFKNIDVIGTQWRVRTFLTRVASEITQTDCAVPKGVYASPVPGCPQLLLPVTVNMVLTEGDLDSKALLLQVSTYDRDELSHHGLLAVLPCTLDKPVTCLAFVEEVKLASDTVKYLVENLDALSVQLQGDHYFTVPRTIMFNFPQNPEERVCGLLMRALLTLDKARQFCHLMHNELLAGHKSRVNRQHERYRAELITLSVYTRQLQVKLHGHWCYEYFTSSIRNWLDSTPHCSVFGIKKHVFVQNLLKTLVAEPYNPGNCFAVNQSNSAN